MRMPVRLDLGGAVIDHIDFEPHGTVSVRGWGLGDRVPACVVETVEGTLAPAATYRCAREDVCAALGIEEPRRALDRVPGHDATVSSVEMEGRSLAVPDIVAMMLKAKQAGHGDLLEGDRVLHRSDIYGEGPPSNSVHPEILKLARPLQPPILDFGCGSGVLLRMLHAAGV
jgi:hypothetical protein